MWNKALAHIAIELARKIQIQINSNAIAQQYVWLNRWMQIYYQICHLFLVHLYFVPIEIGHHLLASAKCMDLNVDYSSWIRTKWCVVCARVCQCVIDWYWRDANRVNGHFCVFQMETIFNWNSPGMNQPIHTHTHAETRRRTHTQMQRHAFDTKKRRNKRMRNKKKQSTGGKQMTESHINVTCIHLGHMS